MDDLLMLAKIGVPESIKERPDVYAELEPGAPEIVVPLGSSMSGTTTRNPASASAGI